jgi:hypothetical protein
MADALTNVVRRKDRPVRRSVLVVKSVSQTVDDAPKARTNKAPIATETGARTARAAAQSHHGAFLI